MSFERMLFDTMMKQVLRTPEGRAAMLTQIADAEDNGEAAIFDQAIGVVDDPRFQKMIARHRDDEVRHGRLFRECAGRQGVRIDPLPRELKILEHLDDLYEGFLHRPLESVEHVVRAFSILQAVEERAVLQFSLFEPLFRIYDRESAEVMREVAADERAHLKYCEAIARHYAKSDAMRAAELDLARFSEAIAFRRTERATAAHLDRLGVIQNPIMRVVWRVLTRSEGPPQPAFELAAG